MTRLPSHVETQIAKAYASSDYRCSLSDLSANLLRILSGAGQPDLIATQIADLANALNAYRRIAGHMPRASEVQAALDRARISAQASPPASAFIPPAEDNVIGGALAICASRLMDQDAQTTKGRHQMYDGVARLQEQRVETVTTSQASKAASDATRTP